MGDGGPQVLVWVAALAAALVLLAGWVSQSFVRVTVYEWQVGMLFRRGRLVRTLPAGRYRHRKGATTIQCHDGRAQWLVVSGQEVMTRDTVGLKLSIAVEWRMVDPVTVVRATPDPAALVQTLVQLAIRPVIGRRDLEAVLAGRDTLAEEIAAAVRPRLIETGLELVSLSVRDLMLSKEIRAGYAAVVVARKEGEALLERARGETAALRSLANAARLVKDNPDLLQLRALQAMMGREGGQRTLVVGLPATGSILTPHPSTPE